MSSATINAQLRFTARRVSAARTAYEQETRPEKREEWRIKLREREVAYRVARRIAAAVTCKVLA